MTKQNRIKEELKPFEKMEQTLVFEDKEAQVYFELIEGHPKLLVAFLDDDDNEILNKEMPNCAFIKPYTNKARLFVLNNTEKNMKIEFKIVYGVRII